MTPDRDDPRLTAYIMGELDEAETQEIESALAEDDGLHRFADELRAVARMSQEALAEGNGLALTDAQRDAIMAEAESSPTPRKHWLRRASMALLPVAACALFVASVAYLYGSVPAPPGDEQVLGKAGEGIPEEVRQQMEATGYLGGEGRRAGARDVKGDEKATAQVNTEANTTPEAISESFVAGTAEEAPEQPLEFGLGEDGDFGAFDYSAGGGSRSGASTSWAYRAARAGDGDRASGEAKPEAAAATPPAERAEERLLSQAAQDKVVSTPPETGDRLDKPAQIAVNGVALSQEAISGNELDGLSRSMEAWGVADRLPSAQSAPVADAKAQPCGGVAATPLKTIDKTVDARAPARMEEEIHDNVEVYQAFVEPSASENGAQTGETLARNGFSGGGGYGAPGAGGNPAGGGYGGGATRFDNGATGGVVQARTRLNFKADFTKESLQYDIDGDGVVSEEVRLYTKRDGNPVLDYLSFGYGLSVGTGPGSESYAVVPENPFLRVLDQPLSTFSIDVDTASYTNIRRFLNDGAWPPPDAVRIEEMINYFSYDYPQPEGQDPFSVNVDVGPCPWAQEHRLARIGLKGRDVAMEDHEGVNLVFLLDVSGSMRDADKLPLLKEAMTLLVKRLSERDRVAIVTYRDSANTVLDSTPCDKGKKILKAIDALEAKGSTNGGAGLELAYEIAGEGFIAGGVNRVVLATDGDFNVGTTEDDALVRLITQRAQGKVFLTVLGFGTGNIKDDKLEALADKGNGNYYYIDGFKEARRVLAQQLAGTLAPIAKDVKIQVEFNPAKVGAYRLIGYENRALAARDFNDDRKDAGEIGSGHTVTALYELIPAGEDIHEPGVDPLKYQRPVEPPAEVVDSPELMTVKLRYKAPEGDESELIQVPVTAPEAFEEGATFKSKESRFAAAVAAFGMVLRGSPHTQDMSFGDIIELAESGKGGEKEGEREEFIDLVVAAKTLDNEE